MPAFPAKLSGTLIDGRQKVPAPTVFMVGITVVKL